MKRPTLWSDILVVPEPSSGLLVTGGLALMARLRRRSRR
ncbi:MAG: PEP-CTERM sorting domain-containing protein [Verrucomicrobiia bacterium]